MIDHREASRKIGRNLKKIRLEMHLTQMDVAVATNLNESYISRIETGKARVTFNLLEQLTSGLKFSSKQLIGDKW